MHLFQLDCVSGEKILTMNQILLSPTPFVKTNGYQSRTRFAGCLHVRRWIHFTTPTIYKLQASLGASPAEQAVITFAGD